jgi:vancomycin resistance protein VanJ
MRPWARWAAKWLRRGAAVFGVLYPVALVAVAAMIRLIGEGWPVTAVALYLPRLGFAAPLPFVIGGLLAFRLRRLLWAQLASVFVLVFVLMGLELPWPHAADPNAATLRILSYNVDSARAGADRIVGEIDAHSPDIVLLQEVDDPGELERLLRSRYLTVSTSTQFLVASRYPVTSSVDPDALSFAGELQAPRFVRQLVETPLGRIALYNVHPVSPRDAFNTLWDHGLRHEIAAGRLFDSENSRVVKENFGLRTLQVESFAAAAARETDPVVIAGDTNLPGLSRTFARNLSGYEDGFTKAGWGFGYTYPRGKHTPWMRLDRILSNGRLRFVDFDVCASTASDHLCVVATLQRP